MVASSTIGRRACISASGPLVGSNEIDVAQRLLGEMDFIRPTCRKDIDMQLVWDGTMFMERLGGNYQDAQGNDSDRRDGGVSVHGLGADSLGAVGGHAGVVGRRGDLYVCVRFRV